MAARRPTIIIADDFTGACDTGVQLARPGAPVTVLVWPRRTGARSALRRDGVVVVDTETRHVPAETARSRVSSAVRSVASGVEIIYKKIDSTLRGNIAAELAAVAEAYSDRGIVVAPAYPAGGRTTLNGVCLVNGVPVHESEFARDVRSPAPSSRIADLFWRGARSGRVTPTGRGDAALLNSLAAGEVLILDAETDAELDAIAATTTAMERPPILVGSAGLAGAVARSVLGADLTRPAHDDRQVGSALAGRTDRHRPVLGLLGSLSDTSRAQASFLEKRRPEVVILELSPDAAATAAAALARDASVLVATPVPAHGAPRSTAQAAGAYARALGEVARVCLEAAPATALFAAGGDTALAVLEGVGADRVRVHREIEPGVPLLSIAGAETREVTPFGTKAGGFGRQETMVTVFDSLARVDVPAPEPTSRAAKEAP